MMKLVNSPVTFLWCEWMNMSEHETLHAAVRLKDYYQYVGHSYVLLSNSIHTQLAVASCFRAAPQAEVGIYQMRLFLIGSQLTQNKLHLKLSVWLVYFCYFFQIVLFWAQVSRLPFFWVVFLYVLVPPCLWGGCYFLPFVLWVGGCWVDQAQHQNGSCRHQPSVSFMFLLCSHTTAACVFLFVCLFFWC